MRTHTSALKRVVGGGFALATAAAFIVPGVASAEAAPDTGSAASLQELLPDAGSSESPAAADEGGDSMFGSVTDLLGCFSSGSGDTETPAAEGEGDGDTGMGSVTTIIDCVMGAIGGGDDTGGEV
ncbi:hypothetical protein [Tomitella fengzijianii]|uniref:Secreted protein n=1 Tax=Tomitella fengzijianii TaxID=2597660 RepID=A0A516X5J1_9ACTN|nr:hypothetical protein [Tomitella fengzijianii]QDQ98324.1 hypothetical protein FO059_14650 [Tomitella fengzijianii]